MFHFSRLGNSQRLDAAQSYMMQPQAKLLEDTARLNSGQNRLTLFEDYAASIDSMKLGDEFSEKEQMEKNKNEAFSELTLADSSLVAMLDLLTELRAEAVNGASDQLGEDDRAILGEQVRSKGENLLQLLNSKLGDKYIFSGKQSNLKTINLDTDADFNAATYLEGETELGVKSVFGIESGVSLSSLLETSELAATMTGSVASPTVTGDISLRIEDGDGGYIETGDISLVGANLTATITAINTAFTAAGGAGAIAQESPTGYLNLTTDLVTGNQDNSKARITIQEGTSPGTALADIGLSVQTARGRSGNLMNTLSRLESGYSLNDADEIRAVLNDLDANIDRVLQARTTIGSLSNRLERSANADIEMQLDIRETKSRLDDIEVAEAINKVTQAQAVVNSSLDIASVMFGQNIFDFFR